MFFVNHGLFFLKLASIGVSLDGQLLLDVTVRDPLRNDVRRIS